MQPDGDRSCAGLPRNPRTLPALPAVNCPSGTLIQSLHQRFDLLVLFRAFFGLFGFFDKNKDSFWYFSIKGHNFVNGFYSDVPLIFEYFSCGERISKGILWWRPPIDRELMLN